VAAAQGGNRGPLRGARALSVPVVRETSIPGLFSVDLEVHGDERGWFKENYQEAKLVEAGLPALRYVQNNVSYNAVAGVTRGFHAEPWDKYVSLAAGSAFAAVVDLRAGEGFGRVETFELGTALALLVPRGCGNAFQTLEDGTVYAYLVTAHWAPGATYTAVDLFDPDLAVRWPVPSDRAVVSEKDARNPRLRDIEPVSAF
jgi:dTDP-4-dehydrorhamnose 3,5-epimerase